MELGLSQSRCFLNKHSLVLCSVTAMSIETDGVNYNFLIVEYFQNCQVNKISFLMVSDVEARPMVVCMGSRASMDQSSYSCWNHSVLTLAGRMAYPIL